MPALPRPDLPPGPHRDLVDALHDLHHRAGWPSLRTLAKAAACSHTTVSAVFSKPGLPSWGNLELLVEAMDGGTADFHRLWLAASASNDEAPQVAPTIAGRRSELAAVRRHLESGAGLLLVTGEAGIGKTRLVTTAADLARQRTFVATGTALPLSSEVALLPVAEIMCAIRDVDDGLWLKEAFGDCPAFVRGSLRRLLPEVDAPETLPDPDDGWSRQRLFTAVGSTLAALATVRRFAVVLEDLHWADAMTLDLIEVLAGRLDAVPMVGTYRLVDSGARPLATDWYLRLRRAPTVLTVELAPLSRDETAEQLELLTGHPPSTTAVERIHHRSEGHPLFTEQLAAQHDDDQALPRFLADLLDQRLNGLSDEAWAAARALAVADRPLSDTVLRSVTDLSPAALTTGLRELGARHLIVLSSGPHDGRLRHPLIGEAIRRQLVAGEGPDQHRRLADALSRAPDPSAGEVARHWQAAGEPEEELGWRISAARAARGVFAAAEAAAHWLRVIELWPDSGESLEQGSLRLSDAYFEAIDSLKRSAQLEPAAALAEEALGRLAPMTPAATAELYLRAGDIGGIASSAAAGLELVDKAIEIYERLPASLNFVHALRVRAGHLHDLGRYAEARSSVETALQANARVGDQAQQRRLLMDQAWYQFTSGDREDAFASAESAAECVVAELDPHGDIYLGVMHTDLLLLAGAGCDAVEAAGRRGLAVAEQWAIESEVAALLRSNVALALTRAGQVDRSARLVDPVTEGSVSRGHWALHLERALLDLMRGREEAAVARFDAVSALPMKGMSISVDIAEYAAQADLWRGQPQRALDHLVPALGQVVAGDESARAGGAFVHAARAAADLVESLPPTQRPTHARDLVERLRSLRAQARADPLAPHAASAERSAHAAQWAGELSRLAGGQTIDTWVAAATEWDRLERPHDAAYCRWRGAQVALRSGQGTVARRLLKQAARDAAQHVPLGSAIAQTAAYAAAT